MPSQAGCVYYLHPIYCQAILQFYLNLFFAEADNEFDNIAAKLDPSIVRLNFRLDVSVEVARILHA